MHWALGILCSSHAVFFASVFFPVGRLRHPRPGASIPQRAGRTQTVRRIATNFSLLYKIIRS
jgi:hypothetical protein